MERRQRRMQGNHTRYRHENAVSQRDPSRVSNRGNGTETMAGNNNRPRSTFAMTLKQLKQLVEIDEPSEALLKMSLAGGPFEVLLRESRITPEIICAILAALARICDCPTDNTRVLLNRFFVNLLPASVDSDHFLTTKLQLFIAQLTRTTSATERNRHLYLKAAYDLILFLRKLQVTLPRHSRDVIRYLILPMMAQIDFINKKEDVFKKEAVDLLNEINEELVAKEPEEKFEQFANTEKPPSDFRSIDICPSHEDIFSDTDPFIRPNIINGKYADGVDHYLDVQFRLLREDFIRPLREGIGEYTRLLRTDKKAVANKIRDIKIYRKVTIAGHDLKNGDLIFNAKFDTSNLKNIQWKCSKRLLTGSLICLSFNDFATFTFATVAGKREPDKMARGMFQLKFQDDIKNLEMYMKDVSLTMAESQAFFEAYRHNLKVLQHFTTDNFPLKKYIVDVVNAVDCPPYLNLKQNALYDLSDLTCPLVPLPVIPTTATTDGTGKGKAKPEPIARKVLDSLVKPPLCPIKASQCRSINILNDHLWPGKDIFGLDDSQYAALKAALTKQFVIIQGPPGTGKTYVGLRITQALLRNICTDEEDANNNNARAPLFQELLRIKRMPPILIVCYTNHALDQFLEGMLPFCENLVRIGGSSKSDLLNEFNLRSVGSRMRTARNVPTYIFQNIKHNEKALKDIVKSISDSEKILLRIRDKKRAMKDKELDECIHEFSVAHYNSLKFNQPAAGERILFWLGFRENKNQKKEQVTQIKIEADTPIEYEEIDADEEEIRFIQNHRMADFEADDYFQTDNGHKDAEVQPDNIEYEFIHEEGFQFQNHQIRRQVRNMELELKSPDRMSREEALAVTDVRVLDVKDRWRLYRFWVQLMINRLEEIIWKRQQDYSEQWKAMQALRNEEDLFIVRNTRIIGMTTTGAAKYRHIIDGVQPRIIIVEEAAEVLEAHIITSLCTKTDHLILIGDHQQLKPNPTVYELAKKYNLEMSLFERMIKNGIQHHQLKLQHRMRPEISSLLVPHIYRELRDHPSVYRFENVKGVSCNMFFINHDEQEENVADTQSRLNVFEAEFVVQLSKYFILQGYKSSEVTILTMYSGQLFRVRNLMKNHEILKNVRATVVDNFQGEESEIIIISFVRSNDDGEIGFLKVSNRVNVALSRAKKGLFCIGNFDCLSLKSELWKNITAELKRQDAIGDSLKLYCQNHPDTGATVRKASDFKLVPEGGCMLPCQDRLPCGHVCPSLCHILDSNHEEMKCSKPCDKISCQNNHRCKNRCHFGEKCRDCTEKVKKLLPCGHKVDVKCSEKAESAMCSARCEKLLPCLHKCELLCGQKCHPEACKYPVIVNGACGHKITVACSLSEDEDEILVACKAQCAKLLECEDPCQGTCGACKQGRLHRSCQKKCKRILVCGHECKDTCSSGCPPCRQECQNRCNHSKCKLTCGEPCAPCMEACTWKCPHLECSKRCHEPCDRSICKEPCPRKLKCKHQCIGLCGEKCPQFCRICDNEFVTEIFFGDEDEPDARFIELVDCGHILEVEGLLTWLQPSEDPAAGENPEENPAKVSIQLKTCPKCKTVIRKTESVKRVINSCLQDLEMVKLQTFGIVSENRKKQKSLHENILPCFNDFAAPPLNENILLREIIGVLFNATKPTKKQHQSKFSLQSIENMFILWQRFKKVVTNLTPIGRSAGDCMIASSVPRFRKRALHCLHSLKIIGNNNQLLNDITAEIKLLEFVSKAVQAFINSGQNTQGRPFFEEAFKLALNVGPCDAETLVVIKYKIDEGIKLMGGLGIPTDEKEMILKAMQLRKGHWFKCPNGHIYCIADCGGAVTDSVCSECGANIGGTRYRLHAGNTIATIMDGATQTAWPGAM